MIPHRSSGILAHITSLPSPYGIGDIGTSSHSFVSFLNKCEQTYWQFLPITPTNTLFDNSPYMSNSAFAGNPLLISPELLLKDHLVTEEHINKHPSFNTYTTEFNKVQQYKQFLLREAFSRFDEKHSKEFTEFKNKNAWLYNYAVFMTAKELFNDTPWCDWPPDIALRNDEAIRKFEEDHAERINFFCFEQYVFYRQWELLKKVACENNVLLFGDLPIYVSYDSVDVWVHQDIFLLDRKTFKPTHVAGVPPDYFSDTGQRWGNPLYDWQNSSPSIQEKLLSWWVSRLSHLFTQVDLARIDHFRGFESYWAIPENEETAVNGEWLKGPGFPFFTKVQARLGPLRIVAEDLGIITNEVRKLRDQLQFPGMKVLQFAFDGNIENDFLPFNFNSPECVVYTGTHDNDTTVGWYLSDKLDDQLRNDIKKLVNRDLHDNSSIHKDLIYLAQSSISKLCIFPLQDVLGFGNDCKMNSPGIPTGNWRWRCADEFLSDELIHFLTESTRRFGRAKKDEANP